MNGVEHSWPWLALLLLGAGHGINPGMGWLFAVGLGLQEGSGRAVWRALPPLALGHAIAVAAVAGLALLVGLAVPPAALKWAVALTLLAFGTWRLARGRHPRYGGMRVGGRDLTVWSFLMASAHGAGLMVLPFLMAATGGSSAGADALAGGTAAGSAAGAGGGDSAIAVAGHAGHAAHGLQQATVVGGAGDPASVALAASLLHTGGYLLVTGLVAWVVYRKLGLRLLRTAWINLDLVWGGALVVTGLATPWL